jgi:hypothetical protein
MVALKWDQMDQMDQMDQVKQVDGTEQMRSRPHLYVSDDARRPVAARQSGPASGRRQPRRWKFAVRRALVVLVIASLGALAWSAAQRIVAAASTGEGTTTACATVGPGTVGALSCPQAYVATSGDTVWSIAVRFAHGGDPRPLVDRLEAEIGGGVLQPGQRLTVP